MPSIILKNNREQALLRRHPWIFSGAIDKVLGNPEMGDTVIVTDSQEQALAVGAYSPHSQIQVRIWSFDPTTPIDNTFFYNRIQEALERRRRWIPSTVTAYRLVNSEADGLPGVIIDIYGDYIVLQCLNAGANFWRATLVECLQKILPSKSIIERSESKSLAKEGLKPTTGVIVGEPVSSPVTIQEFDTRYYVDIMQGHKTGFYLDQRDNRQLVKRNSKNKTVLNCFAYTGGFGMAALSGGASHVTHIEASAKYAEDINAQVKLNNFDPAKNEVIVGDVFQQLRAFQEEGKRFDLIILDPPKFADSKHQINTACRGYKDINRLAMELLTPHGQLFTFSCSGAMSPDLFSKIVSDAAVDAKRTTFIRQRLSQATDHAVTVFFPEGLYLKGLWCEVE